MCSPFFQPSFPSFCILSSLHQPPIPKLMPRILGFCYKSTVLLCTDFFMSCCCSRTKHPNPSGLKQLFMSLITYDTYVLENLNWAQQGRFDWSLPASLVHLQSLTVREEVWLQVLAGCWGATGRLGHMSVIIKLASLGLFMQCCWQGFQSARNFKSWYARTF